MKPHSSHRQPPVAEAPAEGALTHLPPPSGGAVVLTGGKDAVGRHPPRIPDHELLRCIGQGSYGAVWLARNVMGTFRAVKIVYRVSFSDASPYEREFRGIQKFEPLSRSHDGFVDVLQIGRNDQKGYFYYVMELADDSGINQIPRIQSPNVENGGSNAVGGNFSLGDASTLEPVRPETYCPKTLLTEIDRIGRLPVDRCVSIGLTLAAALQHLHGHGLVHRDIKPSNIIFVNGQPKLADIGLVAEVSEARSFVGTEGFVPPEGPGTSQADIYSLGKVLYELSSGKDRRAYPDPPTCLREFPDRERLLELDEVLRKACALDVRERYASAEALRADLLLLGAGKSLRRLHAIERRLARATRASIAAVVLLAIAIPGFLVALYQKNLAAAAIVRAKQQTHRAELAESDSREKLRDSYLAQSQALRSGRRADKRFAGLELMKKATEIRSDLDVRNEVIACLATPGLRLAHESNTKYAGDIVLDLTTKPYLCAQSDRNGNISVRRLEDDQEICRFAGFGTPLYALCFSSDRHLLGAGYFQNKVPLKFWDLSRQAESSRPDITEFRCIAIAPDSSRAAIAEMHGPVVLHDLRSHTNFWSFQPNALPYTLTFNLTGTRLAVASDQYPVMQVLNTASGEVALSLTNPLGTASAAWQPRGTLLAAACNDGTIQLWDTSTSQKRAVLTGHATSTRRVQFSQSGRLLASSGWDGQLRLFDVAIQREIGSVTFPGNIFTVSEDERWLGFGSPQKIGWFEFAAGHELRFLGYGGEAAGAIWVSDFNPDGRLLAIGYNDGVRLWDPKDGRLIAFVDVPNGRAPFFSPSGHHLYICGSEGLKRWSIEWKESDLPGTITLCNPELICPNGSVSQRSMDKEGKLLAIVRDGGFHLVNLETKEDRLLPSAGIPYKNGCISPNAKWAAVCHPLTNSVFVFDVAANKLERLLPGNEVGEVAFSPDSHIFVTCGKGEYCFWDTTNWRLHFSIPRTDTGNTWGCIDFAPNGNMAAISRTSRQTCLVDAGTGKELATLEPYESAQMGYFAFSPDGTQLAISGYNHPVQLWDLHLLRQELAKLNLDW